MTDRTRDDLTDTEDALRRALAHDAARVSPPERLGAILRDAHEPPALALLDEPLREVPPARRTWLAACAAAAAVVVAVGVGAVLNDQRHPSTPGATASSSAPPTGASATGTGPSSGPSTPATNTSGTGTGTSATVALPVYYIGTAAGGTSPAALVREFVPTDLGGLDNPTVRVGRAVIASLHATDTPYAAVGPGSVSVNVDTPTASGILLTLSSDSGNITLTAIQEAAITYTAQAAAALGDVPVTIDLNPHTFGPLVRAGTFTRKDFAASVLAPIWIDSPYRGQALPTDRAIKVTGLASVFEAQFSWQVLQGSTVVAQGSAKAAEAAPARAAYEISVEGLAAGDYTLRLFEPSQKGDGTLAAETTKTFTVR